VLLYETLTQRPFLIAGPCVIESQDLLFTVAERAKTICEKHGLTYIFKASLIKQTALRLARIVDLA
jgi:2-dehydro-3-deoxyphosphooctonate aldolase (KDO 8-P synthase)